MDVGCRAGRMDNPKQRPELLADELALPWPSWELLLVRLSAFPLKLWCAWESSGALGNKMQILMQKVWARA